MTRIPFRPPNSEDSPMVRRPRRSARRRPHQAAAALVAAQNYAEAGLPVIPLRPCEKRPLTPHGKDDATTDAGQIRQWWTKWPTANIGVRPPCGLVVLDVDPRNGGSSNLCELVRPHGGLPATWTVATGGGGQHLWYRAAGPFKGKLCGGVDIKAQTGYLVMPPSIHPNGNPYAWANDLPIADAPVWLLSMLYKHVRTPARRLEFPANSKADDGLVEFVGTATEGDRNIALFWASCRAAERGAPPALLDRLCAAAGEAGLSTDEIDRTVRSALRLLAA